MLDPTNKSIDTWIKTNDEESFAFAKRAMYVPSSLDALLTPAAGLKACSSAAHPARHSLGCSSF